MCTRANPQVRALFWIRHTPLSDIGPDLVPIHGVSCMLGRWYDGVASIPQSWVKPAHFRVRECRDLVMPALSDHQTCKVHNYVQSVSRHQHFCPLYLEQLHGLTPWTCRYVGALRVRFVHHLARMACSQVRWCADLVSLRVFGGRDWTDDCAPSTTSSCASKAVSAPTLRTDPARAVNPARGMRPCSGVSVRRDVDNVVDFTLEDLSVHVQVHAIVILRIACCRCRQTRCIYHMRWLCVLDV